MDEEIEKLWSLAVPKGNEWQRKDCPIVRSNKGDLRKAWEKARKIVDLKTVELAIQAQAIGRRRDRQSGGYVPQPKMIGSWLREERWADEIIPPETKRETISATCPCGKPALGEQIGKCPECLKRTDEHEIQEHRRRVMENMGLLPLPNEPKQDYYARCRKEALTKLKQMGLK